LKSAHNELVGNMGAPLSTRSLNLVGYLALSQKTPYYPAFGVLTPE